jgi:sarcosine oxidase subunit beta
MTDLPASCDTLIIGAGAYGLSTAWHLACADPARDILVIDAGEFAANGTGRCVGGVRTQWGHESNIRMCLESIAFFEEARARLDYPGGIEFKQHGYLMLSWEDETLDRFRAVQPTQHAHGIDSRILTAEDVREVSPHANQDGLLGGSICMRDGALNPFRWLDALLTDARRRGVQVAYGTRASRLTANGRLKAETSHGTVEAAQVLLCTDWAAPELAATIGVDLPVTRLPVECMVTERFPHLLGPCHISMRHDMAVNQLANGSIVINHGRSRAQVDDISNQPDWFARACRAAVEVAPALADLNVLRGWAGTVSVTPDMQPILCETSQEGLFAAVSAYKGLMTSPAAGRFMADLMTGAGQRDPIAPYVHLDRFASGDLVREPMTNGARVNPD